MTATSAPPTRTQRLRNATHAAHEALDRRIMAARPFADRDHYLRFLRMQYRFHRDVDALFGHPALAAIVPELPQRRRLPAIVQDLADFGQAPPAVDAAPALAATADTATALGWFYVVEGSNLGAAVLLKLAAGLGLDEQAGARHLAGHADGRARHWRGFTVALDALRLDEAEESRLVAAARDAFAHAQGHAEREFAA